MPAKSAPAPAPAPAPKGAAVAPASVTLTEEQLDALIAASVAAAVAAAKPAKAAKAAAPAPVAWSERDRSHLALIGWDTLRWVDAVQHARKPASDAQQRDAGTRETPDSVFHRAIFQALKAANGTLPAPALARLIAATDNQAGRAMKRQKPDEIASILSQVYGRKAYFLRGVFTVPSLFQL
jgi:hypothetical protein